MIKDIVPDYEKITDPEKQSYYKLLFDNFVNSIENEGLSGGGTDWNKTKVELSEILGLPLESLLVKIIVFYSMGFDAGVTTVCDILESEDETPET